MADTKEKTEPSTNEVLQQIAIYLDDIVKELAEVCYTLTNTPTTSKLFFMANCSLNAAISLSIHEVLGLICLIFIFSHTE